MNTSGFRYWAFISYSHRDRKWGEWLHKSLEAFRVPGRLVGRASRDGTIPRRIAPIFRDREELQTSPDLRTRINEALHASRYLIVICSPNSAGSKWVNEEVKAFKAAGRENRILCVIVDGEPNASESEGGKSRECFPEAIRFQVDPSGAVTLRSAEPIAADARPGRDGKADARLKVLAGLLDVGFDELKRREYQRRVRLLAGTAMASIVIAGATAALAFFAYRQRLAAQASEREARYRSGVALMEQGHALNMAHRWTRGFSALEEGREVMRSLGLPTLPADYRILEAELRSIIPYRYLNWTQIKGMDVSDDGSMLAVSDPHRVQVIDIGFDRPISNFEVGAEIHSIALSPDGTRVAVVLGKSLQVFDSQSGRFLHEAGLDTAHILSAEFVQDGEALVIAASDGGVHAWELGTSKVVKISNRDVGLISADLSEFGQYLAMAWTDGVTEICKFSNLRCTDIRRIQAGNFESMVLSHDGDWLITADGRQLHVWDARTGTHLRESSSNAQNIRIAGDVLFYVDLNRDTFSAFDIEKGILLGSFTSPQDIFDVPNVVFSRKRLALLTTSQDGVQYWQLCLGAISGAGNSTTLPLEPGDLLSVSRDGRLVATGDPRGKVTIFDPYNFVEILAFKAHRGEIFEISFSPDNRLLASAGEDGNAIVWSLDSQKVALRRAFQGGKPTAVAFDGGSRLLAVGTESGEVQIIDIRTGDLDTSPVKVERRIADLAFGPNGDLLAIASAGSAVSVWSRDSRLVREIVSLDSMPLPRVRFGPSGSLLVVAGKASLFEMPVPSRSRPIGSASALVVDAGFLGSDHIYLLENRGLRIVGSENGQEVAILDHDAVMPMSAEASSNGEVIVMSEMFGIKGYSISSALERMNLRRRLASVDVTLEEKTPGERNDLLAQWYLAHGLFRSAQPYLQNLVPENHSTRLLMLSRFARFAGQRELAQGCLAGALARREITPTYYNLVLKSLENDANTDAVFKGGSPPAVTSGGKR